MFQGLVLLGYRYYTEVTGEGKYIARKDLYNKEVVGWAVADHMRTRIMFDAIRVQ